MKIVRCSWFPPIRFKAIALVWWIIVRSDVEMTSEDINHEEIHGKQQREMLVLLFFLWYAVEFIIRLILNPMNYMKVYRRISFEQEAYENDSNLSYLDGRKPYSWIKYLKIK